VGREASTVIYQKTTSFRRNHEAVGLDWSSVVIRADRPADRRASLKDPAKLFNAGLEGNARRAIDIHEGETIDADAFKALVRAAVSLNTSGGKKRASGAK
jgi:hypothetical protein